MAAARGALSGQASARWNREALLALPILGSVHAVLRGLDTDRFPDLETLNRLAARRGLQSRQGAIIRFVTPGPPSRRLEDQYEIRVLRRGEVQTRHEHWHDLFNALVWLTFPRTKAALNALHCREMEARIGESQRGPVRDALTLFDEGGLILASADPTLDALLRARRWKALFVDRRDAVLRAMRFFVFGHAILEKALSPYPGVTARALSVPVDPGFFALDTEEQLAALDAAASVALTDPLSLRHSGRIGALPVLGVPGWTLENERSDFYDDERIFRPVRRDDNRSS